MGDEFRSIVAADVVRFPLLPNDFLHETDQSRCRYGMRDFLGDGDTVAVVDDVEYAEFAVALQNVRHEIHRPGHVFLFRSRKRILDARRRVLARRLPLVETDPPVHPKNPLVVPWMSILAKQPEYFPAPPLAISAFCLMAASTPEVSLVGSLWKNDLWKPINLHARAMPMPYSSAISPAISLRTPGVRVFFRRPRGEFRCPVG